MARIIIIKGLSTNSISKALTLRKNGSYPLILDITQDGNHIEIDNPTFIVIDRHNEIFPAMDHGLIPVIHDPELKTIRLLEPCEVIKGL